MKQGSLLVKKEPNYQQFIISAASRTWCYSFLYDKCASNDEDVRVLEPGVWLYHAPTGQIEVSVLRCANKN